jgi:hypothetical protein
MKKPHNFTLARWAGRRFCSQACHGASRLGATPETSTEALLRRIAPDARTGCHNWTGSTNKHGYGTLTHGNRKVAAHRLAYVVWVGEIPPEMQVCHRCDNRSCINPAHLFLGTNLENLADRQAKGRQARGETHARAKLTEQDVRAIRSSVRRYADIAADYRVSETTVSNIISRRSWAHVPD